MANCRLVPDPAGSGMVTQHTLSSEVPIDLVRVRIQLLCFWGGPVEADAYVQTNLGTRLCRLSAILDRPLHRVAVANRADVRITQNGDIVPSVAARALHQAQLHGVFAGPGWEIAYGVCIPRADVVQWEVRHAAIVTRHIQRSG